MAPFRRGAGLRAEALRAPGLSPKHPFQNTASGNEQRGILQGPSDA